MARATTAKGDEPFERALWRFLLVAYASGETVEGDWHLMDTDPMVPNLVVVVERLESEDVDPDSGDHLGVPADHEMGFKERLQSFLLSRFSCGVDVEGTWTVRYDRVAIPDWTVRITSTADTVVVGGDTGRSRSC